MADKKEKQRWTNKQRVLVFASRGITFQDRHLLLNLRAMLPHCKTDSKMDKKDPIEAINQICEVKNCNKAIYILNRRRKDSYMWLSNTPRGPSALFLIENTHTLEELRMPGNCLKSSRPLLSFDPVFDEKPHLKLLKELFVQIFGTPNNHPKSQPFIDHVFNFSYLDGRIWFRNYEILDEKTVDLNEIGPRFTLNLIKIFEGSFGGPIIYSNPDYVTPTKHRSMIKKQALEKYKKSKMSEVQREMRMPHNGEEYKDIDKYGDIYEESEEEAIVEDDLESIDDDLMQV